MAVLVAGWLAGCTTVHPRTSSGTGRYYAITQRLVWVYPFPLETVREATFAALAVLQYGIEFQQFDGLGGTLTARPVVGGKRTLGSIRSRIAPRKYMSGCGAPAAEKRQSESTPRFAPNSAWSTNGLGARSLHGLQKRPFGVHAGQV